MSVPCLPSLHSAADVRFSDAGTAGLDPGGIAGNLLRYGAHVFPAALPSAQWFSGAYHIFDNLATRFQSDRRFAREWATAVRTWRGRGDNATFYCNVPMEFRDRALRTDKRDKAYLQYCVEFGAFLRRTRLGADRDVAVLATYFGSLHEICAQLLETALGSICDQPNVLARLRGSYSARRRPIVFKLVRYNPNLRRFGTNPHYDKSALSLLLHADDDAVSYRLAPHRSGALRCSEMSTPITYPQSPLARNDAVLIPGLCLQHAAIADIPATPHGVLPVTSTRPRHSIIAFYLVPHLDTSALSTAVDYIADHDPHVS